MQLKIQNLYIANEYKSLSGKSKMLTRQGYVLISHPLEVLLVEGIIPKTFGFHYHITTNASYSRLWRSPKIDPQLNALRLPWLKIFSNSTTWIFAKFPCTVNCLFTNFRFILLPFMLLTWSSDKCVVHEFNLFGLPCPKIWKQLKAYIFTGWVTKSRYLIISLTLNNIGNI